jgi:hypothetical protein
MVLLKVSSVCACFVHTCVCVCMCVCVCVFVCMCVNVYVLMWIGLFVSTGKDKASGMQLGSCLCIVINNPCVNTGRGGETLLGLSP